MSAGAQEATALFIERLAQDLNDKRLELPAFPDSVIRIQQAVQDENKDVDDIVNILSSDPALAARLLQLANSAAMRTGGGEISDVRTDSATRLEVSQQRGSIVCHAAAAA